MAAAAFIVSGASLLAAHSPAMVKQAPTAFLLDKLQELLYTISILSFKVIAKQSVAASAPLRCLRIHCRD